MKQRCWRIVVDLTLLGLFIVGASTLYSVTFYAVWHRWPW